MAFGRHKDKNRKSTYRLFFFLQKLVSSTAKAGEPRAPCAPDASEQASPTALLSKTNSTHQPCSCETRTAFFSGWPPRAYELAATIVAITLADVASAHSLQFKDTCFPGSQVARARGLSETTKAAIAAPTTTTTTTKTTTPTTPTPNKQPTSDHHQQSTTNVQSIKQASERASERAARRPRTRRRRTRTRTTGTSQQRQRQRHHHHQQK